MCRLLAVRASKPFVVRPYLESFALISRNSREYQGHGWGCAVEHEGRWHVYRNIQPVWEDNLSRFHDTTCLVAHARSAFRDEGIRVENNMPFLDSRSVFIFNGELHGVRIQESGRIGAEKIFNHIRRFDRGNVADALEKSTSIIRKRSRYVKAMNIVMADKDHIYISTDFSEDADYFTLWKKHGHGFAAVCSEPFPGETGWEPVKNHTLEVLDI